MGIIDAALSGVFPEEFIDSGFSKNCIYAARRADACASTGEPPQGTVDPIA
jgi:hypothetical protein